MSTVAHKNIDTEMWRERQSRETKPGRTREGEGGEKRQGDGEKRRRGREKDVRHLKRHRTREAS